MSSQIVVYRSWQLNLSSGVMPLVYDGKPDENKQWFKDVNHEWAAAVIFCAVTPCRIAWAIEYGKERGLFSSGDSIVCVHGLQPWPCLAR